MLKLKFQSSCIEQSIVLLEATQRKKTKRKNFSLYYYIYI